MRGAAELGKALADAATMRTSSGIHNNQQVGKKKKSTVWKYNQIHVIHLSNPKSGLWVRRIDKVNSVISWLFYKKVYLFWSLAASAMPSTNAWIA